MSSKEWYIINVYSGSEQSVSDQIRERAAKKGLSDRIEDILIPMENVIEIKGQKKVEVSKKCLPGYILIKMCFDNDMWHLICGIPRVSKFLGSGSQPTRVKDEEVNRIMDYVNKSTGSPRNAVSYEVGDSVKVMEGPFVSFSGFVEEILDDDKLKVSIMVFGRPTPIILEVAQVGKI